LSRKYIEAAEHLSRRGDVFDHIECFYNARRRHSSIGYKTRVGVRNTGRIRLVGYQSNRESKPIDQRHRGYIATVILLVFIFSMRGVSGVRHA
jgi:hypothetical protein